jgi:hypothetical protein
MEKPRYNFLDIVIPGLLLTAAGTFGTAINSSQISESSLVESISGGMQVLQAIPLEYAIGILLLGALTLVYVNIDALIIRYGEAIGFSEEKKSKAKNRPLRFIISLIIRIASGALFVVFIGWYALGPLAFSSNILGNPVASFFTGCLTWLLCFAVWFVFQAISSGKDTPHKAVAKTMTSPVSLAFAVAIGVFASFFASTTVV